MLPADGSKVGKQRFRDHFAAATQVIERTVEIYGVPERDSGGDEGNPNNAGSEGDVRVLQEAARPKGVQLAIVKASSESEIDTAIATLVQLQAGALPQSILARADEVIE